MSSPQTVFPPQSLTAISGLSGAGNFQIVGANVRNPEITTVLTINPLGPQDTAQMTTVFQTGVA